MRRLVILSAGALVAVTLVMGQSYKASMSLAVVTVDTGNGIPVTSLVVDLLLQTITGPSADVGDMRLSVRYNSSALDFGGVAYPLAGYWVGGSYSSQQYNASFDGIATVWISYLSGPGFQIPSTPTLATRIGFLVKDPSATEDLQWYFGNPLILGTRIEDVNGTLLNSQFTFTNPANISMIIGVVEPKVLLEGPYNPATQLMDTTLKRDGMLAAHFPGVVVADSSVDSVSVEIRDTPAGVTKYSQPAWLRMDGTIRAFYDTSKSYVEFPEIAGNYYVVIHHRNHLSVMSAAAQSVTNFSPVYDFTTGQDKAYGGSAMKAIGALFGMVAGDANGNGQIANSDINDVIRPRLGQAGYFNADINLNGQIQNSDINDFTRLNLGRGTQVP